MAFRDHGIPLTRRSLAMGVARAGGVGAVLSTLSALRLLPTATPSQAAIPISRTHHGATILVIGAGIGGLVAALELTQAGYEVIVLEARERPGGRVWTLRSGDVAEEIDGVRQRVTWDAQPHLYFNAGAARIPNHHQTILGL
jgi:monoamine oxidase